MNARYLSGLIVVALIIGLAYFFTSGEPEPTSEEQPQVREQAYASDVYGLSFSYSSEYELREHDAPGSELRKQHTIVLIHKDSLPLPEVGEGPPTITIDVHQNNLDNQTTEDWIRNTSSSNFKLGEGVLASTTVGGVPALSYRWSGLYEGTTIAVARPDWVYAFSVTYLEPGADIVQDFVQVRDSVRFSSD